MSPDNNEKAKDCWAIRQSKNGMRSLACLRGEANRIQILSMVSRADKEIRLPQENVWLVPMRISGHFGKPIRNEIAISHFLLPLSLVFRERGHHEMSWALFSTLFFCGYWQPPMLDQPSPRKSSSVFVEPFGIEQLLLFVHYLSSHVLKFRGA